MLFLGRAGGLGGLWYGCRADSGLGGWEHGAAPAGSGWDWLSKHFSFPELITVSNCMFL